MAKRNLSEPAPGEDQAPPPAEARGSAKLQAPRFSMQLTPEDNENDQSIDLGKMHPNSRARLTRLLKKGDTLKQLGVIEEREQASGAADSVLDTMLAGKAVELVGLLAVIGAQRAGGLSAEASALMAFRNEQRDTLAPLVVRILAKYNLLGGKYAEELAALALVAAMLSDNYQQASKKQAEIDALKQAA